MVKYDRERVKKRTCIFLDWNHRKLIGGTCCADKEAYEDHHQHVHCEHGHSRRGHVSR